MDLWHAGALGVVETSGLANSVAVVDVMAKAAEVKVIGIRRIGGGLVTVSFIGDMASVTAAVDSARRAVVAAGGTVAATVIGRPAVPGDILREPGPAVPAIGTRPAEPAAQPAAEVAGTAPPGTARPAAEAPVAAEPAAGSATAPAATAPAGTTRAGGSPKRRPARSTAPRRRPPAGDATADGPAGDPTGRSPEPPAGPPTERPRGK